MKQRYDENIINQSINHRSNGKKKKKKKKKKFFQKFSLKMPKNTSQAQKTFQKKKR